MFTSYPLGESGYSMRKKHGLSIDTACKSNGYWTHMYASWVRQTMPHCLVQKTPKGAKITANKRFTLNCGSKQAKDDLWTWMTQKWANLAYVTNETVDVTRTRIVVRKKLPLFLFLVLWSVFAHAQ